MATKILTVPLGGNVTYRPNGYPHTFCAVPGAGGTVLLDYSIDGGINFVQSPLGAASNPYSMSTQQLNLGVGFGLVQGPTMAQIPPGAIVRCTAGVAAATFIASELGGPSGTLYERQTLIESAVALLTQNATTEQTVFSARFPVGYLPLNWSLEVETWWTATNNANVKTLKTYFGNSANVINAEGGTNMASDLLTSMAGLRLIRGMAGRNDGATVITSNVGLVAGGGYGSSATANVSITAAYNGTAAVEQALVITATKATGTDAVTLDRISVRLQQ